MSKRYGYKMKFYTKANKLTPYSFSCGYTETKGPSGECLTISREHSVYHVKGFLNKERVWESFRTLTEARKFSSVQRRKKYD
jgi:hypothetical protein